MDKKILIAECPRSGLHFLGNAICFNFTGADNYRILVPRVLETDKLETFFKQANSNRFYKSHHEFYAFEPIMSQMSHFDIFYIFRNGRDVMCSEWNYYKHLSKAPHCSSVSQFMREDPRNYKTDLGYYIKNERGSQ